MKCVYLFGLLLVCVFSACQNVEKMDNIALKIATIKTDLAKEQDFKIVRRNENAKFISIYTRYIGQVSFTETLALLKSDLRLLEITLRTTQKNIYFNMIFPSGDSIVQADVSRLPSIQAHIQEKKQKSRSILNHQLLGKELMNSVTVSKIAAIFKPYNLELKRISVDKCFGKLDENSPELHYWLYCANIGGTLQRIK